MISNKKEVEYNGLDEFDLPGLDLPEFDELDLPEFDLPGLDLPEFDELDLPGLEKSKKER